MWTCKKCGEYRFNDMNVCNCQEFVVINADDEEHKLNAVSEEAAATKYAKKYNENGDYLLMDESIVVRVNGPGGVKSFRLSAEQDIHYSCDEVPNAPIQRAP